MEDDKFVKVGKAIHKPTSFTEEQGRAAIEGVLGRIESVLRHKTPESARTKSKASEALDKDNIVKLDCVTSLPIPPDRVLKEARGKLETVIVLGWDNDGEFYFAASESDGGNAIWLMEKAKKYLLEVGEDA